MANREDFKIYITSAGDPSVGIQGENTYLAMERRLVPGPWWNDFLQEGDWERGRAIFREQLDQAFSELVGESVDVLFEDECPNCRRLKDGCQCDGYD